jgi:molybdenum cofactor biosynthesis protein MoaC
MRDISDKVKTLRTACARATLKLSATTIKLIEENKVPKGDPFQVAKVAAIQAAKNTSLIIPYCHPILIDFIGVEYEIANGTITVDVTVKAIYKTGVEMEALTGASVYALTLYDMLKMLDESMEISSIELISKTGGKSDFKDKFTEQLKAAVLVMSDSIVKGKKEDTSGKAIVERLTNLGVKVVDYKIIADDLETIILQSKDYADKQKLDLVVTTGGTGLSKRDCTPKAMEEIIETKIDGIAEAMRNYGQERTPYSMLSRSASGLRGETLFINLPGSCKGTIESLNAVFPHVLHLFNMMKGGGHTHELARKA